MNNDVSKSLVAIENLVDDYKCVRDKFLSSEPSSAQNILHHLKKMLILSCASHYENAIMDALKDYAKKHSAKCDCSPHGFDKMSEYSFFKIFNFGRNDEIKKPTDFLKDIHCLGEGFKNAIIKEIAEDDSKKAKMNAFREICLMRNALAHCDLISYNVAENKSFDDINNLHKDAMQFVKLFTSKFDII
ncbi:hypothetical protein AGMMS49959_05390 [Planctomycetales bacterium]|nr:hypothetical protein AGMMS49959_05390 [Planctomycetales bacterium]